MIMKEYLKGIDTVETSKGEVIYVKRKEEEE
jgi:hypothetical protein